MEIKQILHKYPSNRSFTNGIYHLNDGFEYDLMTLLDSGFIFWEGDTLYIVHLSAMCCLSASLSAGLFFNVSASDCD